MTPVKAALIYGSTRQGRFCDTVANWVGGEIWSRNDFTLDLIDPRQFELSPHHEQDNSVALQDLGRRLDAADAFVVVTPEYNHGYPAVLKLLLDAAYREWQAKPVAFVSYGGISGGLRAVEQLRLVFAELHAVTIRDCVSFADPWNRFGTDGHPMNLEEARKAMATMLSRLRWWAVALRDARRAAPYGEVVG
ncbi:NAD(P)H-dependent oxidoreductase [Bradyrhizobium sp. LHD-71]|uniref:NADPH-dependent FMN reductase n=1 Tax=Bradyrhizobium sp. LHD-71 TaxID=3072141 RepID=UPI00280D5705|nr:NAD(P)H-dependent oxidoreductase [Bradyrhizobium sp. LHD-71]MDQ8729933.1 NAD(P)H-dependent oxidoreductase [Bradyrhizobium sp. LHD-71]